MSELPLELFGPGALTATGYAAYQIERLLGPARGEVASAIQRWTSHRTRNVGRVLDAAAIKAGSVNEGILNTRVLMKVLDEAGYGDDEVVVQYLGGVLASSATENGRDDRGMSIAATVAQMSSYALRCHFVMYATVSELGRGMATNVEEQPLLQRELAVYARTQDFMAVTGFEDFDVISHATTTLSRANLIFSLKYGPIDYLRADVPHAPDADQHGLVFSPTIAGIELFLWGLGQGQRGNQSLFNVSPDLLRQGEFGPLASGQLVAHMTPPGADPGPAG
jgi:hypothetical protein